MDDIISLLRMRLLLSYWFQLLEYNAGISEPHSQLPWKGTRIRSAIAGLELDFLRYRLAQQRLNLLAHFAHIGAAKHLWSHQPHDFTHVLYTFCASFSEGCLDDFLDFGGT